MRYFKFSLVMILDSALISVALGQIPNPDVNREIIVMFQPNSLELPPGINTSTVERLPFINPDLLAILNQHSVDQVRAAFPDFNREDTLKVTPEGITVKSLDLSRVFVLRLPEAGNRDAFVKSLTTHPRVIYAEPNAMGHPRLVPNDEHFQQYQWNLRSTGQYGAALTADIEVSKAWDTFTGTSGMIVGIVDVGRVWQDHPDLTGRVFGDFSTGVNNHSTHVAGIAAGKGNNSVGIAGVDWNTQVNTQTIGDEPQQAIAVRAAVDAGATVINNSWGQGNNNFSTTVAEAFAYAYKSNVVSSNAMPETGTTEDYPNLYGQAVINVAATSNQGKRASYSEARDYTDVAAPGGNFDGEENHDILSTVPYDNTSPEFTYYDFSYGTSFAAPHVAGIGSLIKGYSIDVLGITLYNDDIENIVKISSDDINDQYDSETGIGWDRGTGWGLVNAQRALGFLRPSYVLYHDSNIGGGSTASLYYFESQYYGVSGLNDGETYCVKYYTVTDNSEPLPVNSRGDGPVYAARVWGRGVDPAGNMGWKIDTPNFGMGYTEATISQSNTQVELKTYVHRVYVKTGNCNYGGVGAEVGWFPTIPGSVRHFYTVIGVETVPVPQGISVGPSGGHPRVTWNPVPVDEVDLVGYHVYRKIGGGPWDRLTNSPQTGTSYTDGTIAISNKLQGTWIEYRVTSVIKNTGSLPDAESDPSVSKGIWGEPLFKGLTQALPEFFALRNNFPNPFNPATTIKYDLPEQSFVILKVYNLMGREIKTLTNGNMEAGYQNVIWDGKDSHGNAVSSGMYLYRLDALSRESDKEFHLTRKMVLLR